ncbi:MAG: hypothetical protein WKF31_13110 [Thermoleophilaceae bacterium]
MADRSPCWPSRFEVISFDNRGVGPLGPPGRALDGAAGMAADAVAVLDAAGLGALTSTASPSAG